MSDFAVTMKTVRADRRAAVSAAARKAGWLDGKRSAIGVRVPTPLLEAAKTQSGLSSTTDVVAYALAKLAIEDDFGPRFLELEGSVPPEIDLGF